RGKEGPERDEGLPLGPRAPGPPPGGGRRPPTVVVIDEDDVVLPEQPVPGPRPETPGSGLAEVGSTLPQDRPRKRRWRLFRRGGDDR
ncbi:MAG TPA: hypothetical protein VNO17_12365, partial [Actinomycetota bacterium]|nr:hypothetical protein [Actinomycetota bacterium]